MTGVLNTGKDKLIIEVAGALSLEEYDRLEKSMDEAIRNSGKAILLDNIKVVGVLHEDGTIELCK